MKLLCVKANGFKNAENGFSISLVAQAKKTAEDKEYELQEIADGLFVYNTMAFVGKNASGKTTAVEMLDCAYSILSQFRLEKKMYSYHGIELTIYFYHDDYIYLYNAQLEENPLGNSAVFKNQVIYKKKYYKTKINTIFSQDGFKKMNDIGNLPDDTSIVFFVLKQRKSRAMYFSSFHYGLQMYSALFHGISIFHITDNVFTKILRIFDNKVKSLTKLDEHNYEACYDGKKLRMSDKELYYFLSSGTTKGILLYMLMTASLHYGFDLVVDEIETHFHRTLVENMIQLYKDKNVNKHNASLIFSTHYPELLDLFGRQDNIWVAKMEDKVKLYNVYKDYDVRSELSKSRQFYNNVFQTAVNYEDLMALKKELMR